MVCGRDGMGKMMQSLFALLLLSIGITINVWFLRTSDASVILWHVFPYFFAWGMYALFKNSSILTGLLFMLVADIWLYTEIYLGTKSSFLMAISILSTLKVVLLFPLGVAVGSFIRRRK